MLGFMRMLMGFAVSGGEGVNCLLRGAHTGYSMVSLDLPRLSRPVTPGETSGGEADSLRRANESGQHT